MEIPDDDLLDNINLDEHVNISLNSFKIYQDQLLECPQVAGSLSTFIEIR